MARQTRAQRKARREAQAQSAAAATQTRSRQQLRPAPAEEPHTSAVERLPGGGIRRFISESWGELQKVDWPNQKQVTTGTVAVIVACAIVGTYLWLADLVLKRLVQNVFLG